MSKALIMASELIKEECSKYQTCKECFFGREDEEGDNFCTIDDLECSPSHWDLSKLEEKND